MRLKSIFFAGMLVLITCYNTKAQTARLVKQVFSTVVRKAEQNPAFTRFATKKGYQYYKERQREEELKKRYQQQYPLSSSRQF